MPRKQLMDTLNALHEQLEADEQLGEHDRAALLQTMQEIQAALAPPARGATATEPIHRTISQSIRRFEATHPRLAELLRSVSESLSNSGI